MTFDEAVDSTIKNVTGSRVRTRALAVVTIILFFDLYEIYLASALASLAVPQLHGGQLSEALVVAMLFVGGAFGAFVMTRVADRRGRRAGLLIAVCVYSLGALCTGASPDLTFMLIGRFVTGIGVGAVQPMTDAYVTDLFRPAARGRAVSVVYTLGYIGTPAAGLLAYEAGIVHPWGVAGWRWLVLLSLIGVVLVALARSWLIESPRWLLSVGRETEAQRLIGRLGAAGRDIATSETPTPFAEQGKFEGIFSPRWRRATITLWLINTFSPFAFYGFGTLAPLILKAEGYTLLSSLAYTALSFFGYPIGSALAILFIDRIDRKWIIAGGHFLLGATGLLFVTANSPVLVVCGGFLFSLVSNIVGNANHVYMAELYPTQLRATGNGTAYTINRIATAIMPIVLVPLLDSGGATLVFVIVGAGLMLITFGVGIFGPHSYDSPLEHRRGRSMRRPAFPGHE